MGKVYCVSTSEKKGMRKTNRDKVRVVNDFGIDIDAHGGKWHRQVSFLAKESIEKMVAMGLNVKPGDFAENITTEGIDLCKYPVGTTLRINDIDFILSQKGKICHNKCAIYYQAGDCVMPKEGIFAIVKGNGEVKPGDDIQLILKKNLSIAVITLSDKGSRGEREDLTGKHIIDYIKNKIDTSFVRYEMIPDEKSILENMLVDFADTQEFDLIITNGSTGVAPRDIAPDITEKIIHKRLLGFEEAMRMESFKKTKHALISRAIAGTRKNSFIINLPGSPKGAIENLETIFDAIPHAIAKLQGDPSDCAVK